MSYSFLEVRQAGILEFLQLRLKKQMGEVQLYHNVAIMLIRFIGASMNLMCYFGLESFSSNMWLMLGHQWKKAIYVGFGSIKGNSRQIHIKDFMMLLQLM